ncbi:chitin deacetylase CDA4 [Aspergillus clavatus NRRL 1]|uniref:chitin deacetylase n=1 Tax=Aspergillus clavatus (strain ATCC 1007 / CBS 513.65 / DSM 816 / NCTC 3887 / NRRL 1 / QM 1276 / 107) TaxID=344612 RepID=A1CB94_ASPCL|nr:polysaccharide deacetylase (NodB), putative [Aspergillus clavatus NRRL 1]EAW13012.1 polysaccharide deacetylase (NodB), putative [Aspergillus clavatus NRRL 1]
MLLPFLLTALLLTPFYCIYKPPSLLIRYLQHRWPDVLFHVPTTKKLVALTIDDAPSQYTADILHELHTHGAHATFFVIGAQVPGREAVLADLVRARNELANHAMHDEPSRALSDEVLAGQLAAVQARIRAAYEAAGVPEREPGVGAAAGERYFRPGSGFFSASMRELVRALGYRLVLGSVYPHDPQIPYWRVNAAHVLGMVRPGSIIICHDRREWTLPMLRKVLPELKRRGYRVVTLTELLREGQGMGS